MKTNTSVRDAEPHNNTCPMVWRVDQSPHTGPKAFAAMRQNVARKQCTTTPQAIGKATRPSQKQPDTQREGPAKLKIYWARTPHECNRGGREGSNRNTTTTHRRAQVQRGRKTEHTETKHAGQTHTSKHEQTDSEDPQKRTRQRAE